MMKKPASAKAKAQAASACKRPRSSAASSAPQAKSLRREEVMPVPARVASTSFDDSSIRLQLQEALARAATAEARADLAKEDAKRALEECKDATTLAQQRSERAASAEGQLKMLREVYDQMHEAYNGSMTLVKSVLSTLKNRTADAAGWGSETDTLPLQNGNEPLPIADSTAQTSTSAFTAGLSASPSKDDCAPSPPPMTPMRGPKVTPEMTPPNHLRYVTEKADPKKVLSEVKWPATINEWGQLQNKVWAGHDALPKDWLRVWSKSHDTTYYLNLSTRTTTFNLSEVK